MPPSNAFPIPRSGAQSVPRPTLSSCILRPYTTQHIRCGNSCTKLSRGSYLRIPARAWNDGFMHPRSSLARDVYALPAAQYLSSVASSEAAATRGPQRPVPPDYLDEKERAIFDMLNDSLDPLELEVQDISGGCGSMYAIAITADKFKGLSVIKQHRMVNEILGEDIKSWHGLQLRTKSP